MNAASPDLPLALRQRRFAGYVRDPERCPPPSDVPPDRMAIYRELFFNNIKGVLEDAFPALRVHLSESDWLAWLQRFFAEYRSASPYVHRLPGEFARWLAQQPPTDPPFLAEVADYEWLELQLALAPAEFSEGGGGDPLTGFPVLAPLCRLAAYRYPVHRIREEQRALPATPTQLLLWRDRAERVRTLELNPVTARLLSEMAVHPDRCGRDLLLDIAAELRHPAPEQLIAHGRELLSELQAKEVIAEFRSPTEPTKCVT